MLCTPLFLDKSKCVAVNVHFVITCMNYRCIDIQYSVSIHISCYGTNLINSVLGMQYTYIKFVLIVFYVQLLPYTICPEHEVIYECPFCYSMMQSSSVESANGGIAGTTSATVKSAQADYILKLISTWQLYTKIVEHLQRTSTIRGSVFYMYTDRTCVFVCELCSLSYYTQALCCVYIQLYMRLFVFACMGQHVKLGVGSVDIFRSGCTGLGMTAN